MLRCGIVLQGCSQNPRLHASLLIKDFAFMPMLTVRNLPEEVHRALRARATRHGRSTEAEVRAILEQAVRPDSRVRLGSLLAEIGRRARLTDEEAALLAPRDRTPAQPLSFE